MNVSFETQERAVTEALGVSASPVVRLRAGEWRFPMVNGKSGPVHGRLDEGWLELRVPIHPSHESSPWSLLRIGSHLHGPAKIAMRSGGRAPDLRADLSLDGDVDLEARVAAACSGLAAGLGLIDGQKTAAPAAGTSGAAGRDLGALLQEAGWSYTDRDGGARIVDLEAPRGPYRAEVTDRKGLGVRLAAPLAHAGTLSHPSQEAIGLLLLTASARLRLARGAVLSAQRGLNLQLEVVFPRTPSAAEIDHALAALSVGCANFGPETEALMEKDLAVNYLLARGVASRQ
jgi:hypothetical protein